MLCCDVAGDNAKVIVVFGSTGQQGGSVVRAIKDDKNFIVKAATRNTNSKEAKQLAAEGKPGIDYYYTVGISSINEC